VPAIGSSGAQKVIEVIDRLDTLATLEPLIKIAAPGELASSAQIAACMT